MKLLTVTVVAAVWLYDRWDRICTATERELLRAAIAAARRVFDEHG